jgi:hypothetical protein
MSISAKKCIWLLIWILSLLHGWIKGVNDSRKSHKKLAKQLYVIVPSSGVKESTFWKKVQLYPKLRIVFFMEKSRILCKLELRENDDYVGGYFHLMVH